MSQPGDDRILYLFYDTKMEMSPSVAADNISMDRKHVNERLQVLADHGLLKKPSRGRYYISDLGIDYVRGELDPGDLS